MEIKEIQSPKIKKLHYDLKKCEFDAINLFLNDLKIILTDGFLHCKYTKCRKCVR